MKRFFLTMCFAAGCATESGGGAPTPFPPIPAPSPTPTLPFFRSATAWSLHGPAAPTTVVITDLDADDAPDIIAADGIPNLVILRGNGAGRFHLPQRVTTTSTLRFERLLAFDGNADGNVDVVSLDVSGALRLHVGDGNGALSAGAEISTTVVTAIGTAILGTNGEELLVGSDGSAHSMRATPIGLVPSWSGTAIPEMVTALMGADADGDLDVDLVLAGQAAGSPPKLRVLLNGTAGLVAATEQELFVGPTRIETFDDDGDAREDLLLITPPLVSIGRATETPGTYSVTNLPYFGTAAIAADVTGDGRVDLINAGSGLLRVRRGLAPSTFEGTPTQIPGFSGAILEAALLDGDSTFDLVLLSEDFQVFSVFLAE